jgi:hypothetical protein
VTCCASPSWPAPADVEDEPDLAVMLRRVFQEGYRVTLAGDLGQARAALARAPGCPT